MREFSSTKLVSPSSSPSSPEQLIVGSCVSEGRVMECGIFFKTACVPSIVTQGASDCNMDCVVVDEKGDLAKSSWRGSLLLGNNRRSRAWAGQHRTSTPSISNTALPYPLHIIIITSNLLQVLLGSNTGDRSFPHLPGLHSDTLPVPNTNSVGRNG